MWSPQPLRTPLGMLGMRLTAEKPLLPGCHVVFLSYPSINQALPELSTHHVPTAPLSNFTVNQVGFDVSQVKSEQTEQQMSMSVHRGAELVLAKVASFQLPKEPWKIGECCLHTRFEPRLQFPSGRVSSQHS